MNTTSETTENLFVSKEGWDRHSNLLREQFPLLTNEDLEFEPGGEEQLLARIQARLYKNREEVQLIIKKWGEHKQGV